VRGLWRLTDGEVDASANDDGRGDLEDDEDDIYGVME
jgi:hypothetical protein